MAEAQGQFENPEKHPPLEAGTRGLVKRQQSLLY
jgi:hypothetical protein